MKEKAREIDAKAILEVLKRIFDSATPDVCNEFWSYCRLMPPFHVSPILEALVENAVLETEV
jgi:hypothetical protein